GAWADALKPARRQLHDENLVEGVLALLLGLKDDPRLVGREVALAGANEVARDLADVLETEVFLLVPILRRRLRQNHRPGQRVPHCSALRDQRLDCARKQHHYRW